MVEIFHLHFLDSFSLCLSPSTGLNKSVVSAIIHGFRLFCSTVLRGCAALLPHHHPETFGRGELNAPRLGLPAQRLKLPCCL